MWNSQPCHSSAFLLWPAAPAVFVNLGKVSVCFWDAILNNQKPSFITDAQAFRSETWQELQKATGMSSSCRYGPFGIWWGQNIVHLIRLNLYCRLMPMWPERQQSRFGSNTRLSRIELSPFCNCCFFVFHLFDAFFPPQVNWVLCVPR